METNRQTTVTEFTNNDPPGGSDLGIISDAQRYIFEVVNIAGLSCLISCFGIAANIINLHIFFLQGFSSTVNISFFGLAISDTICLLTLLWISLCQNPLVRSKAPWVPSEFEYLTGAWPHIVSSRITSFITVYVTAERCLCVLAPLKIKRIITPTGATVSIFFIYLLNILTVLPEYSSTYLDWKLIPQNNRTLLAIHFTSSRAQFSGFSFLINSMTGLVSFIAVVLFTAILAVKLNQTSEWRQQISLREVQSQPMTRRDKKTVKMIVLIATVLIVCYTPGTMFGLTTFINPEFDMRRRYVNLGVAMWSLGFIFQALNSSVNIILYYKMSSKYRATFRHIFCRDKSLDIDY